MISTNDWLKAGDYFDYREQRIFFRDTQEDKPALVLIHGFPTSSWDWEALWQPLSKKWRLIAMDMIGFGFSAKPRGYDYSLVDQASLIESLLDRLGIDDCVLLAHDYGDSVAQELLARAYYDESKRHLRSITYLNGGLFPETHRPRPIQNLLMSPLGPLIARLTSRRTFDKTMCGIFGKESQPSQLTLDAFWELISRERGRLVFPKLIRYMAERRVMRNRWVVAMQQASIPMQLICGEVDPVSGAHLADRVEEIIPGMRVDRLPAIGHYPQVEAPQDVLDLFSAHIGHIGLG